MLVVLSFGLSLGLIALIGHALLHLDWNSCLLMGAALGCTSGTIVIPALQQISAPEPVKVTLTIEAALGEVIAVLMVGSMLNMGSEPVHAQTASQPTFPTISWSRWLWVSWLAQCGRGCGRWWPTNLTATF